MKQNKRSETNKKTHRTLEKAGRPVTSNCGISHDSKGNANL